MPKFDSTPLFFTILSLIVSVSQVGAGAELEHNLPSVMSLRTDSPAINGATFRNSDLQQVKKMLRSRIVPLDRDMITFKYQAGTNFTPQTLEDVKNRIAGGWAERYFDFDLIEFDQGPGQYAAMDPFSSRSYGRDKPQLYVITLAQGSKILDNTRDYESDERGIFEEIYRRMQCGKLSNRLNYNVDIPEPETFNDIIGRLRTSEEPSCRKLIIQAVKDLGIQIILYDLESVGNLSECRQYRNQAVDVIRSNAIRKDSVAYYDDYTKYEGESYSGFVAALFQESSLDPIFRGRYMGRQLQIVESLKDAVVDSDSYRLWKRSHIYRCGSPWFSEESAH